MRKTAEILNIGLINNDICQEVKRALLKEGWIFVTKETKDEITLSIYESKEEMIDWNQRLAEVSGKNYDELIQKSLQAIQTLYKGWGYFKNERE